MLDRLRGMNPLQTRVPNRIRELREARGITPERLTVLLEDRGGPRRNRTTVFRWETGYVQVPDRVKLELARFFGVSIPYLMGWPEGVPEDDGQEAA